LERRTERALDFAPVAALDWNEGDVARKALADISRECARSARGGMSVVVLAIRLRVPDDAGNPETMRSQMRALLRRVLDTLRHTDTVVRLDEREIVAVLPGADHDGGVAAAARLARISAVHAKKRRGFVFDLGVAALTVEDESPSDLVERARAAYGAVPETGLQTS
jgi:GGDEF domain-containing protein